MPIDPLSATALRAGGKWLYDELSKSQEGDPAGAFDATVGRGWARFVDERGDLLH